MNLGAPEFLIYFIVPIALYFLLTKGLKKTEVLRSSLFGSEARELFFKKTKQSGIFLTCLSFILFGVALIRPQFGYREILEEREGQDIAFVVDVSQSMLAKDLSPNRLGRVRFAITDLLSHLKGDRVGLISFAGVSFIESPLTYDYSTFRLFLDDLSPDLIPVAGTNIESALKRVIQLYGGKERKFISGRGKTVILFSDGEELSGNLESVSAELKELGIRVYTVGIGSEVGAPIPTDQGYKRDKGGKVILSKLDRKSLEKLAHATDGAYLGGELSGHELERFFKEEISSGKEKSKIAGGVVRVWQEYYQVTLLLGLVCYFISALGRRNLIVASLTFIICFPGNSWADSLEEASAYYAEGNFRKAFELYESAKTGTSPIPAELGSAKSLYKLKRFFEAKERYQKLVEMEKRPEFLYNLGNTQTQLGQYEEAIKSYEEALTIAPNDTETKENLEYVKKLLKQDSSSSSPSSSEQSSNNSSTSEQKQGGSGGSQSSSQSNESSQDSQKSSGGGQSESSSSSSTSPSGGESSSLSSEESSSNSSSKNGGKSESSISSKETNSGQDSSPSSASSVEKASSGKDQKLPSEREEMLYDSVQEDRGALRKYREEKAIEELEERQESPPEKDW